MCKRKQKRKEKGFQTFCSRSLLQSHLLLIDDQLKDKAHRSVWEKHTEQISTGGRNGKKGRKKWMKIKNVGKDERKQRRKEKNR